VIVECVGGLYCVYIAVIADVHSMTWLGVSVVVMMRVGRRARCVYAGVCTVGVG